MPKYSVDYYVDGIYVKTYILNDIDEEYAFERVKDMVNEEQLLDIEEIDV